MKKRFLRTNLRTLLALSMVVGGMQSIVPAQTVNTRHKRIVGLWNVQVTVLDCSTGTPLARFQGLHKYELGGTGQVVPATNPAELSAHMAIWSYVQKNRYRQTFKMFRFDAAGNNIGWAVVRNNVVINEDATAYAGSGKAEIFDANGNRLGTSCPTFTGTRFQ